MRETATRKLTACARTKMKRCPQCNRVETDDAFAFCRADGTALISDSASVDSERGQDRPNLLVRLLADGRQLALSRGTQTSNMILIRDFR